MGAQDIERGSAKGASRPATRDKPAEEMLEDALVTLTDEDVCLRFDILPPTRSN